MKIEIQPFEDRWTAAAVDFNRRLDDARTPHIVRVPESPQPDMLARGKAPFWQESFLAVEGSMVRGGYILYHQQWSIGGEILATANPTRPISEGVVNGAYGLVGIKLLQHAARRERLLFGMGLGPGHATELLKATGWDIHPIPLYFKILNGDAFLREFSAVRKRFPRLADAAAACGLGTTGVKLASVFERRGNSRGYSAEPVELFSKWADDIWDSARGDYAVLEVRNLPVLNALFAGRGDMTCLRVSKNGLTIGWAVVHRPPDRQERFGAMDVAAILDCLAKSEHADGVIWAATEFLRDQGADVILSNQSHPAWKTALRRAAFFRGPTTYLFASAPPLTEILKQADPERTGMHFNRGGGDIPLEWRVSDGARHHAECVQLQEM